MMHVRYPICALLFTAMACSQQSVPSQVEFSFATSSFEAQNAYLPASVTGLATTGFCYIVNVTGPDIMATNEVDSCGHGPRGRGKVFGPFKYGDRVPVEIPAGADRQFDLLGFKAPAGDVSCEGKLKFVPDGDGEKVYYGDIQLDADINHIDPDNFIYLFMRSPRMNLLPGPQTITIKPIEGKSLRGFAARYPRKYGCGALGNADLQITDPANDIQFGTVQSLDSKTVTLTNNGQAEATGIADLSNWGLGFKFGNTGSGYVYPGLSPLVGSRCGTTLAAGESCELGLIFDPGALLSGTYTSILTLSYNDGRQLEKGLRATYDSGSLVLDGSSPALHFESDLAISDTHFLVIRNAGLSHVTFGTAAIAGCSRFTFESGMFPGNAGSEYCKSGLAPGLTCKISLNFSPAEIGPVNSVLSINYSVGASTKTLVLTLTGTGQ